MMVLSGNIRLYSRSFAFIRGKRFCISLWLCASVALLTACGKHPEPPLVITTTHAGEEVVRVDVTPDMPKKDIPQGVEPSEVVSHVTFSHAGGAIGSITTTNEKHGIFTKKKPQTYVNCRNCHVSGGPAVPLPFDSSRPAGPVIWPWLLGLAAVLGVVFAVRKWLSRFTWFTRIFGRFL